MENTILLIIMFLIIAGFGFWVVRKITFLEAKLPEKTEIEEPDEKEQIERKKFEEGMKSILEYGTGMKNDTD